MDKSIFNPEPISESVTLCSGAFKKTGYSNYTGGELVKTLRDGETEGGSGIGTDTSGSGAWGGVITSIANVLGSVASNIWGNSSGYMATAYQTMYDRERSTTNMLIGIIVAIVVLAFTILILKKH